MEHICGRLYLKKMSIIHIVKFYHKNDVSNLVEILTYPDL